MHTYESVHWKFKAIYSYMSKTHISNDSRKVRNQTSAGIKEFQHAMFNVITTNPDYLWLSVFK